MDRQYKKEDIESIGLSLKGAMDLTKDRPWTVEVIHSYPSPLHSWRQDMMMMMMMMMMMNFLVTVHPLPF